MNIQMRQKFLFILITLWLSINAGSLAQDQKSDFMKSLMALPGVNGVEKLESNRYDEKYLLRITQNVDGDNADKGTFTQRVIVGLKGLDRPTVIVTEGYYANYALAPGYEEELCRLFDANLVFCEYRYFAESTPQPCNWEYMTVDNSLRDLHNVRQTLGEIFTEKWISTGISKGGQTTMFYRATYPDDMDISVSYVAPLNKNVEDGRHEKFLADEVGTSQEREAVLKAQQEILKRRDRLMPHFSRLVDEKGYSYNAPLDEIYDYCLMEYPFALWQWGTPVSTIPSPEASDNEWFSHFIKVSSPDYFSCPNQYLPFFVQAARELGYYGYSTKGLEEWCTVKNPEGYLDKLMLPDELKGIKFDKKLYKRTVKYLKKNDPKHLFIYGEIDPWTASGVAGWLDCSKKKNMRIYVQPRGSHTARISNMPDPMKTEIMARLTEWLK